MSLSLHLLQRSASRIRFLPYYYQHDISLHTSHYTVYLSLSPHENNSPKDRLYTGQLLNNLSHSSLFPIHNGAFLTTLESITTMQIQPPLTIQIMIRWSSDFINTLAYTLYHMSWVHMVKSHLWSMWLSIYMDRLKIQISLQSVFNLCLLLQHSNSYR